MELLLERKWKKYTYTIGILYINGTRFCETLEDKDRELTNAMSEAAITSKKVYGQTAIPTGTYLVNMSIISPKYSAKDWYKKNCNGGRIPRLMDVKGFSGVLIHPGNTATDSLGCILVGRNTIKGGLSSSKDTFLKLYEKLYQAYKKGESIRLTIK